MQNKRYYNPLENTEVIHPKPLGEPRHDHPSPLHNKQYKIKRREQRGPLSFLARLRIDDIILIALLLILIFENEQERDLSLILGVGFLLITEFLD